MKKAYTYLLIIFIIPILISCLQNKLGKTLDLESISMNFDIKKFYGDAIEMTEKYEEQNKEIRNGKKEAEFGNDLLNFWDFPVIGIDTIVYRRPDINNWPSESRHEPWRIIGIEYYMKSWPYEDSIPVARYRNLNFETIDMIENPKGKFMALFAQNEKAKTKKSDFKKLLNHLIKEYGIQLVSRGTSDATNAYAPNKYNYYQWNTNNNLIHIATKYNDKEHLNSIGINTSELTIDSIKKDIIDVKLFIVNPKMKDSLAGRLDSYGWFHLK